MSISSPFISRPIATSLLMVAILLSGIISYQFIPISSLPTMDYPTIQVSTSYPGASPKVMASSVTSPLERQFGQMPGLNQMSSSSSSGLSLITLQFSLALNLDVAEQEVQAAINSASGYLPLGLPHPPIYNKVNPADTPIITLALTSDTIPLSEVEDFAETRLVQKLSQISGVGLVSIKGGNRPSVRIKVNPSKLTSYGLSTGDIRTAIKNSNINGAKGSFDGDNLAYNINANDQLILSKDYANLIISYNNSAPVRLKDVADVTDDVENNKQAAWFNNTPAIIINIQRQPGSNVIKVADEIKNMLPKLSKSFPSKIKLSILSDRTKTIRASIEDVQFELILSIILVVIVMFLFLRNFSATIIPSISVPLSLVGSLGFMYFFGFSLNNLTLMALTIATGFVVDDAIVMIENISRHIELGETPISAAFRGASQIAFTIMSLTISLIAVLIPLFFMQDVTGRLFHEFAITLAISIILSALISLTLTPMLCALILKNDGNHHHNIIIDYLEKSLDYLIDQYSRSLKIVLNHQAATLIVAMLIMMMTLLLFYAIPSGFFPSQDTNLIQAISETRQDTSFANMKKEQEKLNKLILEDDAVESISSFIGIDGNNTTLNTGRILINLKDIGKRKIGLDQVITRIESKLSLSKLYMQPVQDITIDDRITRSQYQYSISSHNSNEVSHYSSLLLEILQKNPKLKNVTIDLQDKNLQTYLEIDRDQASRFGITMANIIDTLYDIYGQRQISTIFAERNQYYVIIEALPKFMKHSNSLSNVYIKSSSGNLIPITSISKISKSFAPSLILRQNQFPVSILSFNLAKNTSLGEAVKIIKKARDDLHIPEHMQCIFQGSAAAFDNSTSNQIWLILATIIVVYIVLGMLYESYIHPITILSTLPSACMGAILALFLFGKDLDVISVIGIILLIGIVKKNAIMMIDFALDSQRNNHTKASDAIFEACILRFRPILMTTLAALFGAIPLVVTNGIGSEIRSPLGITIIGGLLVSQILTLYTTPVIYLAFDKLSARFHKVDHK